MAKTNIIVEAATKYEKIFEDDYTKETWKFDTIKTKAGPVEVSIHYKPAYTKLVSDTALATKQRKKDSKKLEKLKKFI